MTPANYGNNVNVPATAPAELEERDSHPTPS